ncbi:hypothetical protein ScPMuIL_018828 [Solemya velum]
MAGQSDSLHSTSPIVPPSLEELTDISKRLNLKCTDEELASFKDVYHSIIESSHKVVDRMAGKTLPVKYPRTPGYYLPPHENPLNAWVCMCNIQGVESGKLAGERVALKDSIAVAGVPMSCGSRILEGYVPEFDATVATRILDAGGCIAGKTACEDLCFSGSSFTSATGPVPNPHRPTHTSGGSSCGSAALIANGDVKMAIGGDQGGSIRIPASCCGVVGLKPTHGLVPYTGVIPIEGRLDHVGPIANSVQNCALLLEVIAGYDNGLDPRQKGAMVVPEYSKQLSASIRGKKIGLVKEGFIDCDNDVVSLVKEAAKSLTEAGAVVEEVSIPLHSDGRAISTTTSLQGEYYYMLNGHGLGSGWKGFYPASYQEAFDKGLALRPFDLSVTTKLVYMFGEYMNNNYQMKFYAKGMNAALLLSEAYDEALKEYDVLVMPTIPIKPKPLPKKGTSIQGLLQHASGMSSNTSPFNTTGHPALTINTGISDGLPVGMMIVGRHFDETSLELTVYSCPVLCTVLGPVRVGCGSLRPGGHAGLTRQRRHQKLISAKVGIVQDDFDAGLMTSSQSLYGPIGDTRAVRKDGGYS